MGPEFGLGLVKGAGFALIFFVIWLIAKGVSKGTKIAHQKVKNALMSEDEKSNKN